MIYRHALPILLLVTPTLLLCACKREDAETNADPAPQVSVTGTTVTFRQNPIGFRTVPVEGARTTALALPGRLAWDEDHTVRIYSPFSGRVVRILVQIGDRVKVGEPLAELASADFGQAQADARKADTDRTLARKALDRADELQPAGVIAQKDLEQARADYRRADVEFDRAQTRLRLVGAENGPNFILKAPLDGIVVDKAVNPGQELRADQSGPPLFLVTDPTRLWVWLDAPESEIAQLPAPGTDTSLALMTAAYPDAHFNGHLVQTAEFIDPVTRTYKLRGVIDNPARRLKAEMYVSVTLAAPAGTPLQLVQSVPTATVFLSGGHRYAFVRESPQKFSRVEVQVLRERADWLTVSGLNLPAEIVVEGNLYLQQFLDNAQLAPSSTESTADSTPEPAATRS